MTTTATFKFCTCCGTRAPKRTRVCKVCGVPAIWRQPTEQEIADSQNRNDRMESLLQDLIKGA